MSTSVTPNYKYLDGGSTLRGKWYQMGWDVFFSNENKTAPELLVACMNLPELPKPFSACPMNSAATCVSVLPRTGESALHWVVVARWETGELVVSGSPTDPPNSDLPPWLQPRKKVWRTETEMVPADIDVLGDPITNSATESYNPPERKRRSKLVLTITKAVLGWSSASFDGYKDKTNANMFYGYGLGQVLFGGVTASDEWWNGIAYAQVEYTFYIDPDGWKITKIDEGLRKKVTAPDGKITFEVITDSLLQPLSQPTLLDGQGGVLATGAKAVMRNFTIYEPAVFEDFGA